MTSNIVFSKLTPESGGLLYSLRNDESIRIFMDDPGAIPYANHLEWLGNYFSGASWDKVFIVYCSNKPKGICLIRDPQKGLAEMGVMIKDPNLNSGFGVKCCVLLTHYMFSDFGINNVISHSRHDNRNVISISEKLGGVEVPYFEDSRRTFIFMKDRCYENSLYSRILERCINNFSVVG